MSLLSTIFKIPTKAQIGFLKLDASIKETHKREAKISDNEVEDGATISNHIKLSPKSLAIEGHVSSDPISILGLGVSTDDFLGAADAFIDGDKNSFEGLVKSPRRTPLEAWKYLEELMENRVPFAIITTLQRYDNMAITKLSAPRAASNGKDLVFNAEVREVRIAVSSTTAIPQSKTTSNSASSKGKQGKQSGKEASGKQTDDSSILLKGFKKVGIF